MASGADVGPRAGRLRALETPAVGQAAALQSARPRPCSLPGKAQDGTEV